MHGAVAHNGVLDSASNVQGDKTSKTPDEGDVSQFEDSVKRFVDPAGLGQFNPEEFDGVGSKGRCKVASERRQKQQGVNRLVR